jgi:type I restriction enzyme S subunit
VKLIKLGNLASIQTGKIDVNKAVVGGKYPFFTCSRDVYQINDAPFEGKAVLVAGNGDLNVKYYEGKFNAYQRTYFLFVNNEEELLPRYLYWFLESYIGQLRSESIGSTIKYIKMGNLTDAEIPLPPLEKQLEIVEKLDSGFAEIDLLEDNLIKRAELLELLLQGALSIPYKSATSNTANSVELGEIADFQGGSQPAKSNFLYKEQKGYVRFIQIRDFGSDKHLTFIPIANKNRLCSKSDILIGRYGASVGKILTGLDGAYNVALMKVIPKNEIVDRDYLYFYLLSEIFQTSLLKVSDRSAQNGFSKDDICGFPVIIPSLREQKKIVANLSKVRNNILELNLIQLKTKDELAFLRKSLLNSTFTQEEAVA